MNPRTKKRLVLGLGSGLFLLAVVTAVPLASNFLTPVQSVYKHRLHEPSIQPLGAVEVPLVYWTSPAFPNGLPVGSTNAATFADYDGDGWTDIFISASGRLIRNLDGVGWSIGNVSPFLPASPSRYGAALGDYNNDGLLDIATEPRVGGGDSCLHLLKNLGGGVNFQDIALDPLLFSSPNICGVNSETASWADVDDDRDQDLWVTAYPQPADEGSFFFENLGPTGPGGEYRFVETTLAAGMENVVGTQRPEAAQMCDYDRDGDVDAYSHNVIYQNISSTGSPLFRPLRRFQTGIDKPNALDEGGMLFDYDLDGDMDLFIGWTAWGNRLFENRGDGTFVEDRDVIEDRSVGSSLGMGASDWDCDGDIDMMNTDVFRANRRVDDGSRFMELVANDIEDTHLQQVCPAWGDWDRDGDQDVVIANFRNRGYLYENTTYGPETPEIAKTYARVRVVTDNPDVPRGTETEYGATVTLRVAGDESGFVRSQFVASAHGYLNQNEYVLHFGLPDGPNPALPAKGVVFDVVVDFPSLPENRLLRVDKTVNPALGAIELWKLEDKEIDVYRSGKVVLDGFTYLPVNSGLAARLTALPGELQLPTSSSVLPDPTQAPAAAWWVGVEINTNGLVESALLDEVVLDGRFETPLVDKGDRNFTVWDVTPGAEATRVFSARRESGENNRRVFFPAACELVPNRVYRVLARVTDSRTTSITGQVAKAGVELRGGLAFQDVAPADAGRILQAVVDPTGVPMSLRFRAPVITPSEVIPVPAAGRGARR